MYACESYFSMFLCPYVSVHCDIVWHYTKSHDNVLYLVSNAFSHFIVGISVNAENETVQDGPARRAGTNASFYIRMYVHVPSLFVLFYFYSPPRKHHQYLIKVCACICVSVCECYTH